MKERRKKERKEERKEGRKEERKKERKKGHCLQYRAVAGRQCSQKAGTF